jgi:hypothetical protein
MIEPKNKKTWRSARVLKTLAIVKEVDKPTFDSIVGRIEMAGLALPTPVFCVSSGPAREAGHQLRRQPQQDESVLGLFR